MFSLTIDGNIEQMTLQGEATLGEVLEKLSRRISQLGRVITGIKMNDQPLTEGRQYDFKNFPLTSVETIELHTEEPVQLALEALNSSREHLAQLKKTSIRTAELFRLGDEMEANNYYARLMEGLRWLVKGLGAMTGMLGIDENEAVLDGKGLRYYQDEILAPVFDKLYESQKREDWVELADLLEYELVSSLEQWENLVEAFQTKLKAA